MLIYNAEEIIAEHRIQPRSICSRTTQTADDLLELVDVVCEIKNHESRVVQRYLADKSVFVVVNTNLLFRLQ